MKAVLKNVEVGKVSTDATSGVDETTPIQSKIDLVKEVNDRINKRVDYHLYIDMYTDYGSGLSNIFISLVRHFDSSKIDHYHAFNSFHLRIEIGENTIFIRGEILEHLDAVKIEFRFEADDKELLISGLTNMHDYYMQEVHS